MEYTLKLFDVDLIKFQIIENLSDPVLKITWINERKKQLLPTGMELNDKGLALGMNVVPYRISKWKKQLCSVCELYTSKDIAFASF